MGVQHGGVADIEMRKAKALNGVPNNLVQMYFSTLAYYRSGYMPDHLMDVAQRTGLREARIDLLNARIAPQEFSTPALLSYLPILKHHLIAELERKEFPRDHITAAHIEIFVSQQHQAKGLLTGTGTLVTKDGRTIKGKTYTEAANPLRGKSMTMTDVPTRTWWKFW